MQRSSIRQAGLAGVVFSIGMIVVTLLPGTLPASNASASELRNFFAEHRGAILAGGVAAALLLPLLVWWLAGVADVLRSADPDGDGRLYASGVVVAGAVTIGMLAVANSIAIAVVYTKPLSASAGDDVIQMVWNAAILMTLLAGAVLAIPLAAVALASLRSGLFPLWFGWLSGGCAVVTWALSAAAMTGPDARDIGLFAGFVPQLWVIAMGVLMAVRPAPATGPALRHAAAG